VKPNTGAGGNKKKVKTQNIICYPVKPNTGAGRNNKKEKEKLKIIYTIL
jgi:hypothetical protein